MYKPICLALFVVSVLSWDEPVLPVLHPVPCPSYFRYVSTPFGDIEGEITVPYDNSGIMDLRVNSSMSGFFGVGHSTTNLTLLTPISEIGTTENLRYRMGFPVQEAIPQITSIIFNDEIYCSGPPIEHCSKYTNLYAFHKYPPNIPSTLTGRRRVVGVLDISDEGDDYFYPESHVDYETHVLTNCESSYYDDSYYDGDTTKEEKISQIY